MIECGVRFFVTAVSTACAMASMPVHAVTPAGWLMVNSGSRMAKLARVDCLFVYAGWSWVLPAVAFGLLVACF